MMKNDNSFIQQTIYYVLKRNVFVGNLLQELTIRVSKRIPTAELTYDRENAKFEVLLNVDFLKCLELEQRVAVFFHEILHFTNGHIYRFEDVGTEKDQMLKNIAADMAINQYIQNLPAGCDKCPPPNVEEPCKNEKCPGKCIDVKDYKNADGTPFPQFKRFEDYFELLQNTTDKPQKPQDNGKGRSSNWDQIKKYKPFDEHDWAAMDEGEKQRMLEEAKKVVKRTVDKTYSDYSMAPQSVKDLLQEIETKLKALDYKGLLKYAIKKTLSANNRTSTWYRPNKRYGAFAPGSTVDKLPYVNFYVDCSGSISHTEINEFFTVINGFLGTGLRKCNVGFWNTQLYKVRKYRTNEKLLEDDIQSGGTDPLPVLKHIEDNRPNLSIILTDGYFDNANIQLKEKVIWIISEGGNVNHPYKHLGLTIKMENLK